MKPTDECNGGDRTTASFASNPHSRRRDLFYGDGAFLFTASRAQEAQALGNVFVNSINDADSAAEGSGKSLASEPERSTSL